MVQVRTKELRLISLGGHYSISGLASLKYHVSGFGLLSFETWFAGVSSFYSDFSSGLIVYSVTQVWVYLNIIVWV